MPSARQLIFVGGTSKKKIRGRDDDDADLGFIENQVTGGIGPGCVFEPRAVAGAAWAAEPASRGAGPQLGRAQGACGVQAVAAEAASELGSMAPRGQI